MSAPGWVAARENAPAQLFAALPDVPPLIVHLAAWRLRLAAGAGSAWPEVAQIQNHLDAAEKTVLPPCRLPGMAQAAERLVLAVQRGETVGIHGDYDVDGVTSTALLATWLEGLGLTVETILPHRLHDGYGLSQAALRRFAERGCRLVMAVDCGITAVAEAQLARDLGLELIVLDHHEPGPKLPAALVVAPKLPGADLDDRGLAAVGLAYRLCETIAAGGVGDDRMLESLIDLVALGTVADVCPLTGQNRMLVARGISALRRGQRLGPALLARRAGVDLERLTTEDIAFRLGPRLNAAGRLADPRLAFDLLRTGEPDVAGRLASELEELNRSRQLRTDAAMKEAIAQVGPADGAPALLIVRGTDWHPGIVGLVAAKLAEQYHRPAIALTIVDGHYAGSARSVDGFDVAAALAQCNDLLRTGGGHARAAGLSLEFSALAPLQDRLSALAGPRLVSTGPSYMADARVQLRTITCRLLQELDRLGPFGEGNPEPLLLSTGVVVTGSRRVGSMGNHRSFRFRQGNAALDGVQFRADPTVDVRPGSSVDVLFQPRLRRFQGRDQVELGVVALRPVDSQGTAALAAGHE